MAEVASIPAYILSNEHLLYWLLEHALDAPLRSDMQRDYLRESAYVDFHLHNAARPDHVFLQRWQNFCDRYIRQKRISPSAPEFGGDRDGNCSLVLACLECLYDEFLEYSHGELHVRLPQFGWWQNLLSRMSALPIQAHAMWRLHEVAPAYGADQLNATPALFYPYDEGVENYIAETGINDSHIHVNLAGSAEVGWLYALHYLDEEIEAQSRSYENNCMVRELYQAIYADFTPEVLREHLILARRIRYLLMRYADDKGVNFRPSMEEMGMRGEKEFKQKAQQESLKDRLKKMKAAARRKKPADEEEIARLTDLETRLTDEWSAQEIEKKRQRGSSRHLYPVSRLLASLSGLSPLQWRDDDVHSSWGKPEFSSKRLFFHTADVLKERRWLSDVLRRLSYNPDPLVDRLTHIYILLLNEYSKLCVQQENRYGFRQFDKYSQSVSGYAGEIGYYEHVFLNMHGSGYHSITNYAELRIAPKNDVAATQERILKVLHGYLLYLGAMFEPRSARDIPLLAREREKGEQALPADDLLQLLDEYLASPLLLRRVVRPVIVLHLIKSERDSKKEKGDVRFGWQRRSYAKQLENVGAIFALHPNLRKWVRGIDAAADEMKTPPDTFAAVYRYARHHLGIRHATYHAGEDFYHIVSGIRNVCDAVDILEYRRGDRIGHATALGVEPTLWMHTMPDSVTPTRGEWLQDLVFLWSLLHECENMHDLTRKLDYDIREQGYSVFHSPTISPYLLRRVFELRKLNPIILRHFYEDAAMEMTDLLLKSREQRGRDYMLGVPPMVSRLRNKLKNDRQLRWMFSPDEQDVRNCIKEEAPEILELLMAWFCEEETWNRADERIEVPTDYLSADELVLIQQMAMKHLVEKGVVLETLPTSNLRIAQYREMGQHHSARWLGANALAGDSPPPVVLGTDDPGVFATDIKAEFYHIYASLCKRGLNSQAALEKLIAMNQCGARYAFRSLRGNNIDKNPPINFDIALPADSPGFLNKW